MEMSASGVASAEGGDAGGAVRPDPEAPGRSATARRLGDPPGSGGVLAGCRGRGGGRGDGRPAGRADGEGHQGGGEDADGGDQGRRDGPDVVP